MIRCRLQENELSGAAVSCQSRGIRNVSAAIQLFQNFTSLTIFNRSKRDMEFTSYVNKESVRSK